MKLDNVKIANTKDLVIYYDLNVVELLMYVRDGFLYEHDMVNDEHIKLHEIKPEDLVLESYEYFLGKSK